jgi:pyrroline-5-carboxylate reductase
MDNKIAIIGAGNLGLSLAKGLVQSKEYKPSQLNLSRRRIEKLEKMKEEGFNTFNDNTKAIENSKIIIIGVLPQKINEILSELKPKLKHNQLIISLVSGVEIKDMIKIIGNEIPIVRAMPNTAISIRESMTCITTTYLWEKHIKTVKKIFNLVGETAVINEEKMTSATALCACGIAFFLRSIRAASQGGNEIDFHSSEALKMAAQTAKGAAALLLKNNSHPEDEIDKVTSPKGCTIAGLNEMEHNGFSSAFIKGIKVSSEKAKNLYE